MKFEWNVKKTETNQKKHKVSFSEAALIFSDKDILSMYDEQHADTEERWISLGQTPKGKFLVVVHKFNEINGVEIVRLISARNATKKEIEQYLKLRDGV